MGQRLRSCCTVSVRALLVPALLAFAWLVWGAGTAQASPAPSGSHISSLLDSGGSGDPAGAVSGAVPSLLGCERPADRPGSCHRHCVGGCRHRRRRRRRGGGRGHHRDPDSGAGAVPSRPGRRRRGRCDRLIGTAASTAPGSGSSGPTSGSSSCSSGPTSVPLPLPLPGQDAPPAAPHGAGASAPDAGQTGRGDSRPCSS